VEPVGGHERGVRAKQGGYLALVGLELVVSPLERRVLVPRVLQLDHSQGYAGPSPDILEGRSTIAREKERGGLFLSGNPGLARSIDRWLRTSVYEKLDGIVQLS